MYFVGHRISGEPISGHFQSLLRGHQEVQGEWNAGVRGRQHPEAVPGRLPPRGSSTCHLRGAMCQSFTPSAASATTATPSDALRSTRRLSFCPNRRWRLLGHAPS